VILLYGTIDWKGASECALRLKIFIIIGPFSLKNWPAIRDDHLRGIRDVAMREIRNQIIVIHKDSTKKTNQLYRMLHRNPHLGLQFSLRSWWLNYIVTPLCFPLQILHFLLEGYNYYIKSYPPIVLSNILQFILFPLYLITNISLFFLAMIFVVTIFIILLILLP